MSELIYHYTSFDIFKRILKQGAILPDRNEPRNEKEIPTVTFSAHPFWEPTRYRVGRFPNGKLIMLNKALLEQFCGGLVRIVVQSEVAPMDWHEMREQIGMSSEAKKSIYEFALHVGARTSHWFATFESVPVKSWAYVEVLKGDTWTALALADYPSTDDVNLEAELDGIVNINLDNLRPIDVSSSHEGETSDTARLEVDEAPDAAHRESTV